MFARIATQPAVGGTHTDRVHAGYRAAVAAPGERRIADRDDGRAITDGIPSCQRRSSPAGHGGGTWVWLLLENWVIMPSGGLWGSPERGGRPWLLP